MAPPRRMMPGVEKKKNLQEKKKRREINSTLTMAQATKKYQWSVGMTCNGCVSQIEKMLTKVICTYLFNE